MLDGIPAWSMIRPKYFVTTTLQFPLIRFGQHITILINIDSPTFQAKPDYRIALNIS